MYTSLRRHSRSVSVLIAQGGSKGYDFYVAIPAMWSPYLPPFPWTLLNQSKLVFAQWLYKSGMERCSAGISLNLFPLSHLPLPPQVLGLCVERLGPTVVREHVGLVMASLLEHLGDERIAIRHHTLQVRLVSMCPDVSLRLQGGRDPSQD